MAGNNFPSFSTLLNCVRRLLIWLLTSLLAKTSTISISKLVETEAELKKDERRVWEEIHDVWHEMNSCVDKVDQFLCQEEGLKKHTESNNNVGHQVPIEDVPELCSTLKEALKCATKLSEACSKASVGDLFTKSIVACQVWKHKVKTYLENKSQKRIVSILTVAGLAICIDCGCVLSSEENISILHGVVFGALVVIVSLGVIVYDVAKSKRTYQKHMDLCAQLLTSLKTAQTTMSNFRYEIQVIKVFLSAVSDDLSKLDQSKNKAVTNKTAKGPQLQSQQPEESSYRIVKFFKWCISPLRSGKATVNTQTPETLAQTQVDTAKKHTIDFVIVKKLRKVRESLNSLCSKLDECEKEFKEKLGIT